MTSHLERRSGADLIAAERERQVSAEGWTPDHDDEHDHDELARAAVTYATPGNRRQHHLVDYFGKVLSQHIRRSPAGSAVVPTSWPWEPRFWKPSPDTTQGRVRDLVKAGALIAAEIERLQRREEVRDAA